jgi:hypothetical protein
MVFRCVRVRTVGAVMTAGMSRTCDPFPAKRQSVPSRLVDGDTTEVWGALNRLCVIPPLRLSLPWISSRFAIVNMTLGLGRQWLCQT